MYYQGHRVERMVRGEGEANVNYRHVIGSLVRKPGAFARYRFRAQLFPTMHFRLTYDALRQWRGERADVEYHPAPVAATVDSGRCCWRRVSPSTRGGAGPGREGACSSSVRDENLRPPAHGQPGRGGGVRMTHQRDAGPHCAANSSCPPWAPSRWLVSTRRCPNFPGGTGLRKRQPAAPGVPAALGQDLGNLRTTELDQLAQGT